MLRQKNSNGSEPAPTASQTEERGEKGQRFNLGKEGKATAETRGRSVAGNGAGGGEPRAGVAGDAGRPAPGDGQGRIGPGGAPRHGARPREEAGRLGGRGGSRFGGGVLGKGSEGGGERPGGAGGRAGGQGTHAGPAEKGRAREATQGSGGRGGAGEGPAGWGRGGRGPLTITNSSLFQPPPLSHRFPEPRNALTQAQGPCGPQAAAASASRASVARSVPAAPLQRVPPPASAPAAAPPLPVPLPLRQMACGSPAPSCQALARLASPHFPSAGARCRRSGVMPRPARFHALFSILPSFCM